MKKTYQKPESKKVNFSYQQTVVASSGYCDQGWTKETPLIPWENCDKCYNDLIWIGSTAPNV